MTDKPIRIGIVLEGGVLQRVFSDDPRAAGIEYVLIDYDTDGADPGDIYYVPQDGPYGPSAAYLGEGVVGIVPDAGFAELDRVRDEEETVAVVDARDEEEDEDEDEIATGTEG